MPETINGFSVMQAFQVKIDENVSSVRKFERLNIKGSLCYGSFANSLLYVLYIKRKKGVEGEFPLSRSIR